MIRSVCRFSVSCLHSNIVSFLVSRASSAHQRSLPGTDQLPVTLDKLSKKDSFKILGTNVTNSDWLNFANLQRPITGRCWVNDNKDV